MAKQTFTTGQVLTAAQMNSLQSNDFNQTVSVKTASYTLVAADKGTRIEFNTSGSVTCTVNTGIFDAGDTVIIQNRGSGTVTVTAGTATVNTNASLAIGQYGYGTLYFVSASAAIFFADAGGIPASAFTAKGDILVGTGSGTYDKLTVGANNTTIVADSSTSTGLKWAAASSASGPAFSVTRITSNQSLTQNTNVKLQWNSEDFDTANCFDSTTNYRFTPTTAGYYQINVIAWIDQNNATFQTAYLTLYKNSSSYKILSGTKLENFTIGGSLVVYLNGSTDYIEVYGYSTTAAGSFRAGSGDNCFSGVWIRS